MLSSDASACLQELREAVREGETATVRRLLDAGADPNTPDMRKVHHAGKCQSRPFGTVLHLAARGGHQITTAALLAGGADHTATQPHANAAHGEQTALEIAEESDDDPEPSSDEESDSEPDVVDHAATKTGKAEVAGILREWAAAHPDADYDKRVAAYDKHCKEQVRSPLG